MKRLSLAILLLLAALVGFTSVKHLMTPPPPPIVFPQAKTVSVTEIQEIPALPPKPIVLSDLPRSLGGTGDEGSSAALTLENAFKVSYRTTTPVSPEVTSLEGSGPAAWRVDPALAAARPIAATDAVWLDFPVAAWAALRNYEPDAKSQPQYLPQIDEALQSVLTFRVESVMQNFDQLHGDIQAKIRERLTPKPLVKSRTEMVRLIRNNFDPLAPRWEAIEMMYSKLSPDAADITEKEMNGILDTVQSIIIAGSDLPGIERKIASLTENIQFKVMTAFMRAVVEASPRELSAYLSTLQRQTQWRDAGIDLLLAKLPPDSSEAKAWTAARQPTQAKP